MRSDEKMMKILSAKDDEELKEMVKALTDVQKDAVIMAFAKTFRSLPDTLKAYGMIPAEEEG